jgi:hypothetical protein
MTGGLAVPASAQQAPVAPAPAGSTAGPAGPPSQDALQVSVDRIREGLSREPVIRLDSQPVFRVAISERRPRYWDLQSPFLFTVEPRSTTTRWHDEFLSMVTPEEASMYGPLHSSGERAQLVATGLLFAGAVKLVQAGFSEWQENRREAKARAARAEVDAALAAWDAAPR